jgi:hypothetical protein
MKKQAALPYNCYTHKIATSLLWEQIRLLVKVSSILYGIYLRQMAASSQLEGERTGSGQAPSSSKTMAPTCVD